MSLDEVYWQRNRLIAMLARIFPSKLFMPPPEDGDDAWPCVFIQLPTGQISFHIPEKELVQFMGIPKTGENPWDGHSDEEKWRRCLKWILAMEAMKHD